MSQPLYPLSATPDLTVFEFISSGKTSLKKRVKFELIDPVEPLYNLSLSTIDKNGKEDYDSASKNGDIDKVLQTVAGAALSFSNKYPDRKIYFTGTDDARKRAYRSRVFSMTGLISQYFSIEGLVIVDGEEKLREPYIRGKDYQAFIFTKK